MIISTHRYIIHYAADRHRQTDEYIYKRSVGDLSSDVDRPDPDCKLIRKWMEWTMNTHDKYPIPSDGVVHARHRHLWLWAVIR
jgi:hypothetical protein